MNNWLLFAVLSMLFAGITAVVAKHGLQGISADLGNLVRTAVVMFGVSINFILWHPLREVGGLARQNLLWLGVSGLAATLSWVFYYKAIKLGPVSQVALIDKGSVVITILLSAWLLREPLTLRTIAGGAMVVAGLLVLAWKI